MKYFTLFIINFLVVIAVNAQTYEQAIDLLKENKRDEAFAALKKLQITGNNKADISLALSIIDVENGHYLEGFYDFRNFFQNHPNPYPYLYAMYSSGIFASRECITNEDVERFFEELLKDPKANYTIKGCAFNFLGGLDQRQNDFKSARGLYEGLNEVKNWSTVGSFENVSGSGFNKDFGVLSHPESDYLFTNKTGAKVQWFQIPEVRNDRWVDLTYNHYCLESIIYSQTFVQSDADKEVLLLLGASGSMKVWLNDYLICSESEERNTGEDVYSYKVKLQKGNNRLLLQTGSSEISKNNFLARFADFNGNLLTEINSSADFKPYNKAQAYEIKQEPFFAEKYFEDEVLKQPNNFIDQLLLLDVYLHNEKRFEAHRVLATLNNLAPKSTLVKEKIIRTETIDRNDIVVNKEKEFINSNDSESFISLNNRFSDAFSKENWVLADFLINKNISIYGESAFTQANWLYLLSKKKEASKLFDEIDRAYKKYPDDFTIAQMKYLFKRNNEDAQKYKSEINDYFHKYYSVDILNALIDNFIKAGDRKAAIDLLKMDIDNNPVLVGRYNNLAIIYKDLRQYDNALDCIQKCLKLAPYIGRYNYTASLIYSEKGDKEKAKELLRKAVSYAPTDFEIRKKLRELESKKDLWDYFIKDDLMKLYQDALSNENYAKEEAVVLLNDKEVVVYPERGASEEHGELLIYINSQSAINDYKEVKISYNSYSQKLILEKAELLKKDGNKVPAEKLKGQAVFSTLTIGDAVHISYKLENSYKGKLSEYYWDQMYFSSGYPVHIARYSIMLPYDIELNYKIAHKDVSTHKLPVDNFTYYTWVDSNLHKIEPERFMPDDVPEMITVSTIPSWNNVASWYSDISSAKIKADYDIKMEVKKIMAGNENKTEIEKARIIYDYIENNYTYSNVPFLQTAFTPQKASRTLNSKLGDCKDLSALFVSMAKEVGLNANLVLVRQKGSGGDYMPLPTISFNHCIAQLHTEGKDYLVELTNNYLPFSSITPGLINANGLYIPSTEDENNKMELVKLNTNAHPQNKNIRDAKLSIESGKGIIHRNVYKTGVETIFLRQNYRDLDNDDRLKKFTIIINKEFNKNVKVENLVFQNLNTLNDSLSLIYDVTVDNFTNEIAGLTVFKLPWTDVQSSESPLSLQALFSPEKRKYPIDFEIFKISPVQAETITISIPNGKKLAEMPKDVSIDCPALSYSIKYEMKMDKIIATRTLTFIKDIIMPDEYETVKNVVAKISEADTKEMAFK